MWPRLGVVSILVAFCAALSACGATTSTGPSATTGRGHDTQPAKRPAPPSTGAAAPSAIGQQGPTVPNLIGVRLAIAERDLRAGEVNYTVLGRPGAGAAATLIVCATNPLPNTHLEPGTKVRLIVRRTCG